jgi:hypothetical protein
MGIMGTSKPAKTLQERIAEMKSAALDHIEDDPDKPASIKVPRMSHKIRGRIESMLLKGIAINAIRLYCRQEHGVGKDLVDKAIKKIYEQWSIEDQEARPHRRSLQVRRIYRELDAASKDSKHSAVAALERLIAEIQGNKEPERVQIASFNAHAAITELLGSFTDDQVHQLAQDQMVIEAKAELADRAGLAPLLVASTSRPYPSKA